MEEILVVWTAIQAAKSFMLLHATMSRRLSDGRLKSSTKPRYCVGTMLE